MFRPLPALRSLCARRAPSATTLLAGVALFFALSGSVVAATKISRNSVGTAEVKNASLRGGDLAKDTLTGRQIDEETLGVVPRAAAAGSATTAQAAAQAQHAATATRATSSGSADRAASAASADRAGSAATADRAASAGSADRAGDADTVDGRSAAAFASARSVFPVAVLLAAGETKTVIERDGLRFVARCTTGVGTTSGGTADVFTLSVESSDEGASFSGPRNELDGSSGNALGPATAEARRVAIQQSANSGVRVVRVPSTPVSATSAGGTSIFLGAGGAIRVGFNQHGAVCTLAAPVMVTTF